MMIEVTDGQIAYEYRLLLHKLKARDPTKYNRIKNIKDIEVNGIFKVIEGGICEWEKMKEL